MTLRGVGADEIAKLPAAADGVPANPVPGVTLAAPVSSTPRRYTPVRAGSMYPRGVLGPSMAAVPFALSGATGAAEGVIAPFVPPVEIGALPTGGAATPLPSPASVPDSPLIYSGIRDPQHAVFALSTFTDANDTREKFLQRALASYWGTSTFTVATPTLTTGTPSNLLNYTVKSTNWVADSFEFICSSQALLGLFQIQVTLNGDVQWGPQYLLEGRADLNIFATTGQTISVAIIIPSGIDFVASGRIILNGYRDVM